MANCSWCNKYIGDKEKYWYKNVFEDGKEYKSKEIFCSAKCSHEYPYTPSADKSSSTGGCILVLLIVGALIYFSNSDSSNVNTQDSNTEPNKTENIVPDSAQAGEMPPILEARSFEFSNNTKEKIYLAYALNYNSNWESHGWNEIEPNNSKIITLPENFTDEYIYWYAIDAINQEWTGSDKNFCIHPTDQFDYVGKETEDCQETSKGFIKLELTGAITKMGLSNN